MARSGCAMCGGEVAPRKVNKAFPFCSARCQLADLSHWLDGDYCLTDSSAENPFGVANPAESSDPTS